MFIKKISIIFIILIIFINLCFCEIYNSLNIKIQSIKTTNESIKDRYDKSILNAEKFIKQLLDNNINHNVFSDLENKKNELIKSHNEFIESENNLINSLLNLNPVFYEKSYLEVMNNKNISKLEMNLLKSINIYKKNKNIVTENNKEIKKVQDEIIKNENDYTKKRNELFVKSYSKYDSKEKILDYFNKNKKYDKIMYDSYLKIASVDNEILKIKLKYQIKE
jgi:hypothetical protein